MEQREIIRKIIDEHRKIKEHLRLIGDTISDREALVGLDKARSTLTPGQLDRLGEMQEGLQRVFRVLDEGLRNHFALEESSLVSLLGAPLMTALEFEHQEVKQSMEQVRGTIYTKLDGLSRKELIEAEGHMYHALSHLRQSIEGHSSREEVILGMLERALKTE